MSQEYIEWIRNYLPQVFSMPIMENFLGLQPVEIEEGRAKMTAVIDQKHCNFYGYIHGGTLSSILDVAMGVACITLGKRIVTIDMSVSYMKNAPAGTTITAIGSVIGNGRTIMRAVGEIYHGDQLLARSQASYYVTGDFGENEFPAPA
jgi:acyl-CoA thioesterase